jgi:hypothetical protein
MKAGSYLVNREKGKAMFPEYPGPAVFEELKSFFSQVIPGIKKVTRPMIFYLSH